MDAKRGRPTDNPKQRKISVRIDAECEAILNQYCQETGKGQTEAIRDGIRKLKKRRPRSGRKEILHEPDNE